MNQKFNNVKIDLTKSTIPNVHILVQKICFEHGLTWISGGTEVAIINFSYIFINEKTIYNCISADGFKKAILKEVSIQEFLTEQYDSNILLIVSKHMQEYTDISPLPSKWVLQVSNESIIYINEFRSLLSPFFAPVTEKKIGCFIGPEGEGYLSSDKPETSYIISLDHFKFQVLYKLRAEKKTDKAAFTLPEKWCVKVNADATPKFVRTWRGDSWFDEGYINYKRIWDKEIAKGETEITYEQFYEYIFKPWKPWEEKVDSFVLPDSWIVKVTPQSIENINKYRKSIFPAFDNLNARKLNGYINNLGAYQSVNSGLEITYEQFCKHVLTTMKTIEQKKSSQTKATEEFFLPAEWYIKITSESREKISDYRNKKSYSRRYDKEDDGRYMDNTGYTNFDDSLIKDRKTEITYNQFLEHVLAKESKSTFKLKKNWFTEVTAVTLSYVNTFRASTSYDHPIPCPGGYIDNTGKFLDILPYDKDYQFLKPLEFIEEIVVPLKKTKTQDMIITFDSDSKKSESPFTLPEKYCVVHHQEVVDHIIKIEGNNHGSWCEDLKVFSHFPPPRTHYYCYPDVQKGYTEITIEQFREHVILPSTWKDKSFDPVTFKEKTKDFVLPNRWYTKITEESKDALSLYRSTGGRTFQPLLTSTNTGYIDDTGYSYASNSENLKFMTEITYEQFCKYVLFSHLDSSDEFVLPKSYCVRHHKIVADYINKIDKCSNFSEDLSLFSHFPKFKNKHCHKTIQTGYTEISIEDFRKYVTKTSGDPVIEAAKHEIPITVKSTIDLRAWATKSASPSISQSDVEDSSPLEGVIKTKEITNEELFKPKNNLNTIYHGKKAKENPITIDLCTTYPSISRGKK